MRCGEEDDAHDADDRTPGPSRAFDGSDRVSPAVPTLDELDRLKPGERRVFRGVDWDFYERLHDVVGERPWFRIAFDGRDLEIMPVSPLHEADRMDLEPALIEVDRRGARNPVEVRSARRPGSGRRSSGGSRPISVSISRRQGGRGSRQPGTTVRRTSPIIPIRTWRSRSISLGPKVDRPSIYAALRVPEVWRFSGTSADHRATDRAGDLRRRRTQWLPADPSRRGVPAGYSRKIASNILDWKRRLRAWVRAELAGRPR